MTKSYFTGAQMRSMLEPHVGPVTDYTNAEDLAAAVSEVFECEFPTTAYFPTVFGQPDYERIAQMMLGAQEAPK